MGRLFKSRSGLFIQGAVVLGLSLHSPVSAAADEPVAQALNDTAAPKAGSGKKTFVTTGTGVSKMMGQYGQWLDLGQAFRMEFGRSLSEGLGAFLFVDSAIHNGASYEEQAMQECFGFESCIQGDTWFHKVGLGSRLRVVDAATIDVYGRASAGVGVAPLLMNEKAYAQEVVGEAWEGNPPSVHDEIHPFAGVGVYAEFGDFGSGVAPYLALDAIYSVGLGLSPEVLVGFSYRFGGSAGSAEPIPYLTEDAGQVPPPQPPVDADVPEEVDVPEDVEVPEGDEADAEDSDDWRDW